MQFKGIYLKAIYMSKGVLKTQKHSYKDCLIQTVWKNEEFTLTQKIFRQINSFVTFLSKNVDFTKLLLKKCESKFPSFPHCD